jgi:hypothetical protein
MMVALNGGKIYSSVGKIIMQGGILFVTCNDENPRKVADTF